MNTTCLTQSTTRYISHQPSKSIVNVTSTFVLSSHPSLTRQRHQLICWIGVVLEKKIIVRSNHWCEVGQLICEYKCCSPCMSSSHGRTSHAPSPCKSTGSHAVLEYYTHAQIMTTWLSGLQIQCSFQSIKLTCSIAFPVTTWRWLNGGSFERVEWVQLTRFSWPRFNTNR